MLTALLLLIGLYSVALAGASQDRPDGQWPQWRGPDGLGVSADSGLPEHWSDDSANIKWKTKIPGEGCSSPIVSGNRVFVTTAWESSMPQIVRRVSTITGCLLAAIFLLVVLARLIARLRKAPRRNHPTGDRPLGGTLNAIITTLSTALFFLLLVLLFLFPERYDATAGTFLAERLGTYDTEHVFYIGKDVAAATWLNTGAVALLGFAISLYWLRAHSIWRPIGAVVFASLAAAFVAFTPLDAWKYPIVLWTRVLFVVPGSLLAAWHLLGYVEIRIGSQQQRPDAGRSQPSFLKSLNRLLISLPKNDLYRFGGLSSLVLFASVAALAAVVFVPLNLLLPTMGMHRAVVCLDFATGQTLWRSLVFTTPAERKHRDNTYATPTPATDGQYVVANFGAGVVCLDFDGHLLWKAMDPQYPADTRYGAASSVLLYQNRAIIIQEKEENTRRRTWVAAFDLASGDVLWKVEPSQLKMAYTTGLLHNDGTGVKLIVASYQTLLCFELEAGRLLWKHAIPMEQIVASLTRADSLFCVGGGTWGPKGLLAFTLADAGQENPVEELWQASENTPGCASPVMYNGIVFSITDTGVMRAYDAASGTLHWQKRLKGRYLASLVAGDGKVYACNTNALTTVLAAQPQLRILGQNQLQGDCRASFAAVDSHLLVRTADFLYCIAPNTVPTANR